MRGNFTGTISFNADDAKVAPYKSGKSDKGNEWAQINMILHAGKNNTAFTSAIGSKMKTINTMDTENKRIEIAYADRNDPEVVKTVASYRKHVVALNGERREFISDYDFVNFINENRVSFAEKDKKWAVSVNVKKNVYNGKATDRFEIQNIYEVDDDKKEVFRLTAEFYFNKDSVDTADWNTEKKIYFNGYTSEYTKEDGNKYFPLQLVFDCSKIDFDNEKHVKLVNFKLAQMGCSIVDGKVKVNISNKKYYKQMVTVNYMNGSEEIPFDESCLTDMQKEAVELGLKKVEDFRPAGSIYGERVVLYKLVDFPMTGKYEEGYVECDDTVDEFEENIFTVVEEESAEDVLSKAMNKPEPADDDKSDEDDLFG